MQRVFDQSGGTYGADRVTGQLRKDGFSASFKKVKRIMNEHGLFSVHLRYQRSLTDSRGSRDEDCPNLLRGVTELKPYQALSSDITYIHMKKELVMETIRAAANS